MRNIVLLVVCVCTGTFVHAGDYRFMYTAASVAGEGRCDYCQHDNSDLQSTWSVNAGMISGKPICRNDHAGFITVRTVNYTWADVAFESARLVIYDWDGCVEFFRDAFCSENFLVAEDCLPNTTKGPANVTLLEAEASYHYATKCYCFEHNIGPCNCNTRTQATTVVPSQ